jgi:hypothetical protein
MANFVSNGKNDFDLAKWVPAEELLLEFMVIFERVGASSGKTYGDVWLRHGGPINKGTSL